ncbi:MAG: hypothetical protein A3J27_09260 [Candidatus Tectomicrobia bacterium RIFCSPLOWO2_12_FULL_69_37]|nr:MAG: hypothetical protein A3J27_09260 [Candidatus Tectomicrobia bacterium RIFCSPLOWO2_12_FULL_69_37]
MNPVNAPAAPAEAKKPGVIPVIPGEFDDFETEVTRFRKGEIKDTEFTQYRLRRGIYGQRQPDAQMVRVKIPFGGLTADQIEALGRVARDYAPLQKGHVTTRENVQFHFVPLAQAAEVMRLLGETGLTTREACGNTVRNVTGCPFAGVCPGQVFDTTPYAGAFASYFVRKPLIQSLPRKFKVAFSSCASDCVVAGIHDIGFIPVVQHQDGREVRGFRFLVGGGLATMPKVAQELYSFVPVSDFLRVSEAILRVFNASQELRKSKFKARIKFLVDWIGIDGLRERVEEELRQEWARNPVDPGPYLWIDDEEGDVPPLLPMSNGHPAADGELSAFSAWRAANARAQRQAGYFAAEVQLPLGDIRADQFSALADLARRFARGRARTSFQQNLVLRWVREADLLPLWRELKKIGLAEADAGGVTDVVSCPGTDSCKLGITSSMGLAKALREALEKMEISDPLVRKLHIKMSGCPNSCGQHHIADIGFHGGTLKSGGKQLPAYEVFLGGQYMQTGGRTKIGDRIHVRIPAKRVPEALARVLGLYTGRRAAGEEFGAFYRRVGAAPFEAALEDLNQPGAFNEEPELFVDWSRDEAYQLQRGEGECMA